MGSACYSCILERAKFECDLVLSDEEEKLAAMEELLDFMAAHKGGVPALVGTERENIVKRRSGNLDPYVELKHESNVLAEDLLSLAQKFYIESEDKLEALVRIAAAANSMEFGVKGHDFDTATFGKQFDATLHEKLDGDLEDAGRYLDRFENILYFTDNAGEIVFDLFIIEKLEEFGKKVVIAPKSVPVLNDITADELRQMTDRKIEPTGPVVGLSLDQICPGVLEFLWNEDWLILAKGMGNFETITEFDHRLEGRLIYIMRAKCETVARVLGALMGSLIVRTV